MAKFQQHPRGFKSNLVREYHSKYPNATAREIAKMIKSDHNTEISQGMIHNVITNEKEKPVKRRVKSISSDSLVSLQNLTRLSKIVQDCGGVEQTKEMLKVIEGMQLALSSEKTEE